MMKNIAGIARILIILAITLLFDVSYAAQSSVIEPSWKRFGSAGSDFVASLSIPPLRTNLSDPLGGSGSLIIYNTPVHLTGTGVAKGSTDPNAACTALEYVTGNITSLRTVWLCPSPDSPSIHALGAEVSSDGSVLLLALYLHSESPFNIQIRTVDAIISTSTVPESPLGGVQIVRVSIAKMEIIDTYGPLLIGSCQSASGKVVLFPVAPDASEWFATVPMQGECESANAGIGLFHTKGVDGHQWLIAQSDRMELSATLIVGNPDQNVRRVYIAINFQSTVQLGASVAALQPENPQKYVKITENISGRGSFIMLATLTGPFSTYQLAVGGIKSLASDNVVSVSSLKLIPRSIDILASGLIQISTSTHAFVGLVAQAGFRANFQQAPIRTTSAVEQTQVTRVLSFQIVGQNAFLGLLARGSGLGVGSLTVSSQRDDRADLFMFKLHLGSSLNMPMFESDFWIQAAALPILADDVISGGRAVIYPSLTAPFAQFTLFVQSVDKQHNQLVGAQVELSPASVFPAPMASHSMAGSASPAQAWGFVIGILAINAVLGYFAWRYWQNNGAEEWKTIEETMRRQQTEQTV